MLYGVICVQFLGWVYGWVGEVRGWIVLVRNRVLDSSGMVWWLHEYNGSQLKGTGKGVEGVRSDGWVL